MSTPSRRIAPGTERSPDGFTDLLAIDFGAVSKELLKAGPALIVLVVYVFFEYIRPQSRYPAIDVIPWSQVSLAACVGLFLLGKPNLRFDDASDWLMAAFTGLILMSITTGYSPQSGRNDLTAWWNWLILYFLVTRLADSKKTFVLFTGFWMLWNLNMAQYGARSWVMNGFRFRARGVTGSPGWFQNSGEFGIEMAMFLPVTICTYLIVRHHVASWKKLAVLAVPPVILLGVVGSSSRGALIGTAGVALWMVMKSRHRTVTALALAMVTVGIVAIVPAESKARFSAMGDDPDSVRRLTYWGVGLEIMNDHPLLGIGYGSWLPYFADYYFPRLEAEAPALFRQPQLPHNPFVEAGSELGYTGLALYVLMILATLKMNHETRRRSGKMSQEERRFFFFMAHGLDGALIGYLVSGFFVTVLFYPFFWVNLAMTAALVRAARRETTPTVAARKQKRVVSRRPAHRPLSPARSRVG